MSPSSFVDNVYKYILKSPSNSFFTILGTSLINVVSNKCLINVVRLFGIIIFYIGFPKYLKTNNIYKILTSKDINRALLVNDTIPSPTSFTYHWN